LKLSFAEPSLPLLNRAVAPVPFTEIFDGFEEVFPGEIGPEIGSDVHLGVGELPEEKIRERFGIRIKKSGL